MLNKLLLTLLTFLVSASYLSAGGADKDVMELVQLLTKRATPSLSDYYRFYGEGSEEELELELNACEQKGWTPPLTNSKCWDYIKNRHTNEEETVSLYFEWLKTKLPASPKIEIIRTDRMRGKEVLNHDLIHAALDNIDVEFFRTVGAEGDIKHFGVLSITKINGVPVQKLLDNDLKEK